MDNVNIRITRRTEIDNRAHEESIDIDFGRPLTSKLDTSDYRSLERQVKLQAATVSALSAGHHNAGGAEPELVPADREEMQTALAEISQELGCPNTLDDMLFAIDALRKTAPKPTLEWSNTVCAGERVNHAKAIEACTVLGEGWRLPTRVELLSLVDATRHEPAIDTDRFPDTKSGAYWTSTLCAWASSGAWIVNFYYGYAGYSHRDNSYAFVRAVRFVPAGQ